MKTNMNNVTINPIEFKAIALKNERCIIYDIRSALIDRDVDRMNSLVKAWIHAKDNGTVSDADVRRTVNALIEVAYVGKLASVKERKDGRNAVVEVVTTGRVKAWLYTIRRNGYKAIDVTSEKGDRPEEKEVKTVNRKTTVKLTAEDAELLRIVKALRDAGLNAEQIKVALAAKAC